MGVVMFSPTTTGEAGGWVVLFALVFFGYPAAASIVGGTVLIIASFIGVSWKPSFSARLVK